MTKFKKQVLSVVASFALMANMSPVMAANTIQISGNLAGSDNEAEVEVKNETSIVQDNDARVENKFEVKGTTGENEANDNLGGEVFIKTGDTFAHVEASNLLNSNTASVDCCDEADWDVKVAGNGAYSDSEAKVELENETEVWQDNDADVENDVEVEHSTGGNDANRNGGGDVTVKTGDTYAKVLLSTTANANSARIGGNGNGDSSRNVSARILSNLSNSDNEIELELENETSIVQENDADVENDVDVEGKTGYNDANDNLGGAVLINTGSAEALIGLDNMVNFNWASADCFCLVGVDAKIDGNGADTDNEIEAELKGELAVYQGGEKAGNDADLENDVEVEHLTGKNDAERNGGDYEDPAIYTGDADALLVASNTGNVNAYGDQAPDWSDMDFDVDFEFDGALMWAFLGMFL